MAKIITVSQAGIYGELETKKLDISQAGIYGELQTKRNRIGQAGIYIEMQFLLEEKYGPKVIVI